MQKQFSFPKSQRLCKKNAIEWLLLQKTIYKNGCFLVKNVLLEEGEDLSFLIVVPKKKCKRAVDRNALKRKIKEALRKNQKPLLELIRQKGQKRAIGLYFVGVIDSDYFTIEQKIQEIFSFFLSLE